MDCAIRHAVLQTPGCEIEWELRISVANRFASPKFQIKQRLYVAHLQYIRYYI